MFWLYWRVQMDEEFVRALSMYLAIELVKTKPEYQTLEQTFDYAEKIKDWINGTK